MYSGRNEQVSPKIRLMMTLFEDNICQKEVFAHEIIVPLSCITNHTQENNEKKIFCDILLISTYLPGHSY